jgi:GH25 family lysozyme M1 (1,4-beta-N-acetylmuramidase)
MTVYGVDVSHHQGAIDWHAVKADGIGFAILKATEGQSYDWESWYSANVHGALAAGLLVGSYLFMHDQDGVKQADYYVARVRAYGAAGQGQALDVETAPGPDYPTAAETDAAAKRVKALLWLPIISYSGYWYWAGILGNPPMPASVDYYWDSRYVANGTVRRWRTIVDEVPASWFASTRTGGRAPRIVQVNSNALVNGISTPVDLDVFPGTIDELRALLLGGTQPVQEDFMASLTDAEQAEVLAAARQIKNIDNQVGAVVDQRLARVLAWLTTGQGNAMINPTAAYDIPASDRFAAAADAYDFAFKPGASTLNELQAGLNNLMAKLAPLSDDETRILAAVQAGDAALEAAVAKVAPASGVDPEVLRQALADALSRLRATTTLGTEPPPA